MSLNYKNVQDLELETKVRRMPVLFFIFFNFFIHFLRDRVRVGEGQREMETQNPKQPPGSELSTQSLTWGSNLQTARS